jgi:hypothetical protein
MKPTLFTAGHGQCRRPLWADTRATALDQMFICGAPTSPRRSYCEACRKILVVQPTPKATGKQPPKELFS